MTTEKEKNKKKRAKPFSKLLKIIVVFFTFSLLTVSALLFAVIYYNAPVQPVQNQFAPPQIDGITQNQDGTFFIEVRRGESAQSVGRRLESAGLIRDRHFWNLLFRLDSEHLKIGTYRLEGGESQLAIKNLLVSGRQILHKVTIPEGVTLLRASRILEEAGICSAQDFLLAAKDPETVSHYRIPGNSMEGYLFPDTYLFPSEFPASRVVRAMADNFFVRIERIYPDVAKMSMQELNDKVIMASIVEREYRAAEEAPVMAGVFYNRLRVGMALQSCATVEYIITEILGRPHPRVLYNRDLEIRNPYNSYMFPGLPPGPISAPGAVALNAAFSPAQTEFLYFRLTDVQTGRHYFSRTFDEHIRAGELVPKGH